jgi:hypothetical protein
MSSESSEHVTPAVEPELEAMKTAGKAIEALPDSDARGRVLAWLASRFGVTGFEARRADLRPAGTVGRPSEPVGGEIPGIARLTTDGNLEITVRDLKAKNTIDAAIRLAHVVIYASEKLNGEAAVSSRRVLTPILKEFRAYDGNTRTALAGHKGIRRNGDLLSLDLIAKKEAERYVIEILDASINGTWNPSARPSRRASAQKGSAKEESVA